MTLDKIEQFGNVIGKGEYWASFYKHEDFRKEICRVWIEKFIPALEIMIAEESIETESGLKNLSWYEEYLTEISRLENSRWASGNMIEKCEMIREILTVRMDVLTAEFQQQ